MISPKKKISKRILKKIISIALLEDIGTGDVTTSNLIKKKTNGTAVITVKENGIVSGLWIAKSVFKKLDQNVVWKNLVEDGDVVESGQVLVEVKGSLRALLVGERTSLNFLQRMSGIATLTNRVVKLVEGTDAHILDTRKTAPGLRLIDKYAVLCGGGTNHRFGLYDRVLIKDNHIKVAGSITTAVQKFQKQKTNLKIEVECATLKQVEEALLVGVDTIMLDNMSIDSLTKAVALIDKKCEVEASGGITEKNIRDVALTGVDYISMGALTHSPRALDISMKISTKDKE